MNQVMTDVELPVREQLDAYNARDIETFMKCWSEDAQIYEFPDRLLASGIEEIRERHIVRFQETDLHSKLHSRTSVDNLVVDRETVTRTFRKVYEKSMSSLSTR
jgi:putative hydrolase of HD superfamily